ncbi:MAG: hypothetical protein AAF585_27920 [Verrucomicrobiota bacterium]
MKDLKREHQSLFQPSPPDALKRVQVALDFLWADNQRSIHDKVAGDYDYEELIGALLCAESALSGVQGYNEGE